MCISYKTPDSVKMAGKIPSTMTEDDELSKFIFRFCWGKSIGDFSLPCRPYLVSLCPPEVFLLYVEPQPIELVTTPHWVGIIECGVSRHLAIVGVL